MKIIFRNELYNVDLEFHILLTIAFWLLMGTNLCGWR